MKKYWIIALTGFVVLSGTAAVLSLVLFDSPQSSAKSNVSDSYTVTIPETIVKTETIKKSPKQNIQTVTTPVVLEQGGLTLDDTTDSLSLLFVGDTMLGRFVAERSRRAGVQKYPFLQIAGDEDNFFDNFDIVVANLEGPVTTRRAAPDKGDVDFMFDPAIAPMLKEVGIDAVSQANNHTLDQGRAGASESRELLAEAGLTVFGDQVYDDATSSLAIIESQGTKVALLGFNITDNPLNYQDAEAALKSAYEQARYVIVFMHWGAEYQSKPNMTQIELAHWFIDQGVDAVIGAHPHWMQSVEVYNNRPIIYSLGNFIFDQDWSRETNLGLTVGLTLNPDSTAVHLWPIQISKSRPFILEGDNRQSRLDRLANISHESLAEQIKTGKIIIEY